MNTVIPSQPQAITTINGPSIQSQSLTLSRTIGITQSYTDLHRNLPTPDASYSTLSPPNDILHSRSRSSDNPVEAAGSSGMPLSKSARAEIPAKVLAERINNKPVPSGPVVNRSYVHMPSSIYQKHQQRHQPSNYSPPPAQVPPLPLRRPTVGTPTSVSTTPTGVVDRPTPLPRSIPVTISTRDQAQEHPWPTSNAPVLNNAELEKKEPKSVQRRPNTLNLGVSVNSQIGRSQSSYSTQSGREGDSGLCTADSNVQLNNQQHNYCQQSSASEAPSPESSSISSQGEHPQGRKPASNTTTTNNSSATNSSPSPTSSVTSSPYIMLSDSSSLPVLNRLKPQQKDAEDELYSQVLPRSQAPKLSDTTEKLASTPPKPMTTTTIKNGRVATATKRVATTPSAIVNGVLGDIRLDRNLLCKPRKFQRYPQTSSTIVMLDQLHLNFHLHHHLQCHNSWDKKVRTQNGFHSS
uniref:Uncharacterized protein n=1 Tax=Ditylenchus dipsaci TaxID=166011 RepID=A0A915CMH7_9BILA